MARITTPTTHVPENLAETNTLVGEIGITQAEIDKIEAELEAKVAALREAKRERLEALRAGVKANVTALAAFASANRRKLTDGDKRKSVELEAGDFGWRLHPPATKITTSDPEVITLLEEAGLGEYVVETKRLDRERLIADREILDVSGLKFVQTETFFVKPKGANTELTKNRTIKL